MLPNPVISERIIDLSSDEESDASIELTDDDKKYIEKLMSEHNGLKGNDIEKYKSLSKCNIWEKIRLSSNPESTSSFFDIIFMEDENDFEFTKEKRCKIIESLFYEFLVLQTQREQVKKSRGITVVGSKIQNRSVPRKYGSISHSNPVKKHKKQRTKSADKLQKINPLKKSKVKETLRMCDVKKETLTYVRGEEVPTSGVENSKVQQQSQLKSSTANHHKSLQETKPTHSGNKHHISENSKTPRSSRTDSIIDKEKGILTSKTRKVKSQISRPIKEMELLIPTGVSRKIKNHDNIPAETQNISKNPKTPRSTRTDSIIDKERCILTSKTRKVKSQISRPIKEMELLIPTGVSRKIQNPNPIPAEIQKIQKIPMEDPESPFYIPQDCMDITLYQEGLLSHGWNPTQALYEICAYCDWGKPEFLEGGNIYIGGFLCCARVKGHDFMASRRGRTKKTARHLASTQFLSHIGFKLNFNSE